MTEMGIGLATGQVSYEQFIGAFCDRWQYPQPFARSVDGVRIRPMVEVVRILEKLRENGEQEAYLSKEEQHGLIQDVASRADVDDFVKKVIESRVNGAYPPAWQEPDSGNWPHKPMQIVSWCLDKAGRVSKDGSTGRIWLQGV